MPRKVANLEVEVPSKHRHRLAPDLDNPEEEPQNSGGPKSSGKAPKKSSANRKSKRFSPYKSTKSTAAVPPGPATLLSDAVDGLGLDSTAPISSRTRQRKRLGFPKSLPPSAASTRRASAPADMAGVVAAAAGVGPIARQALKEEKFRQKLNGKAKMSWWDSAAAGVANQPVLAGVQRIDEKLGEVNRVALGHRGATSSLQTLARGRNHARQDVNEIEKKREEMVGDFLGDRESGAGSSKDPYAMLPPAEANYSPDHFARRYKKGGSAQQQQSDELPPLKPLRKRSSSLGGGRDAANAAARARVFGGS